jgi:hypothetical protein
MNIRDYPTLPEFLKTVGFIGFADKNCEGPIKTT